jgi:hypothetical protein
MPYDDPDPSDPQELVGVSLPGDDEVTRAMAAAFADEFAQLGYTRDEILELFRAPFYAAIHRAWQLLGEAEIARMVGESVAVWSRVRTVVTDRPDDVDAIPLRLIR